MLIFKTAGVCLNSKPCASDINVTLFLNRVIELTDINEIRKIISVYHDSLVSGHQGVTRTLNSIKKFYSWYGMSKDIKEYIKKCALCERTKINKHGRAPLQITTVASYPFERVYMDIYGPIQSYNGQDYVFTTICELSKLATATTIPNSTAITVADTFIREVILRYGFVDTIISDNGKCFISEVIQNY